MKFKKIKTDYIDAVEIREVKDKIYYLILGNTASSKGYAFMVSKHLFDDCLENRIIMESTIRTFKEAQEELRSKLQDVS